MAVSGVLHIELIEGKDLLAADMNMFGKLTSSDPYVKFKVGNIRIKSKTIMKTLNPRWDDLLHIPIQNKAVDKVLAECYDWDLGSTSDFLGKYFIRVNELEDNTPTEQWIDLTDVDTGKLHWILTFEPMEVDGEAEQVAEEDVDFLEAEGEAMAKKAAANAAASAASAAAAAAAASSADAEDKDGAEGEEEDEEEEMTFGAVTKAKEEFMAIKPWLGAIVAPSGYRKPAGADEAPSRTLDLEFAHGYRAHDSRDNLFYSNKGKIIYPAAGLGIVYDKGNHTQKFFKGHDDDIVSLAVSPDGSLVATGQMGKTPQICVWEASTQRQLACLKGFLQRAVVSLDFSADGKLLVGVGLDDNHSLAVYDWRAQRLVASAKGDAGKVLLAKFNPLNSSEVVSVGIKHIKFWTLSGASLTAKKGTVGKVGEVQTMTSVAFTERGTISGTAGGQLYVFGGNSLVSVMKNAHQGPVTALFADERGMISGGRDGRVVYYNESLKAVRTLDFGTGNEIRALSRSKDGTRTLIGTIQSEVYEEVEGEGEPALLVSAHFDELWGLHVHPERNEYVTVAEDSTVRVWDIDSRRPLRLGELPGKARAVCFSPSGEEIAVGLMDGSLAILDAESLAVKLHKAGDNTREISQVRYSPDGTKLAVSSHDTTTVIYNASTYAKKAVCRGHHSTVTHLDFSADSRVLQTNSLDYELLFWNADSGTQITSASSLKDTKWATWTSVLGWPVQGIWDKFADGTDVNAVCLSHDGTVLANSEDSGRVRLFKYPCIGSGFDRRGKLAARPKSNDYNGHSSHVTNVFWSNGDRYILSTGGQDRSVLQWRVNN